MKRRVLFAATSLLGLSLLAPLAAQAQAQDNKVFRFVPHANLAVLDPIWTTAYVTRNHAYMIYDTLFSDCLLYTSPSPRDRTRSRMPSSA